MYRQFNWAFRRPSSRRLPSCSSFDWGPASPSPSLSYRTSHSDVKDVDPRLFRSHAALAPLPTSKPCIIYYEQLDQDLSFGIPVDEVLYQGKTDFQDIKILKTKHFGKCMIMDNHMQSAESDECVYHESLVHPALLSHPNPRTVFVGGGGEGATVREVLKHKSVTKVVMVDIDKNAVELCKEYLPEWNENIFDDPRLEIIYGDADAFLKTCGMKFDVIIMDICDPTEAGPGWKLYTKEFYTRLKQENMNGPQAILCTQSTGANVNVIIECFSIINSTLRCVFTEVLPYKCDIPSFGCPWGFHICSDDKKYLLGADVDARWIDEEIRAHHRLGEGGERSLRHYDGACHLHMFNLTKFEREACMDEARIFTLEHPVFIT